MRERGIDYFENSRCATYVQQQYAIQNPMQFEGYGEFCWGITASDGPGWVDAQGRRRRATVLRLPRARGALRTRRWDHRALGRGRLAAVRARDRAADDPALRRAEARHARPVRLQGDLQPDLSGRAERPRLGFALPLRDRPGAGRPDDRELPQRSALGPDAPLRADPTGLRRAGFRGGWL